MGAQLYIQWCIDPFWWHGLFKLIKLNFVPSKFKSILLHEKGLKTYDLKNIS